jgi:hypothetical protein
MVLFPGSVFRDAARRPHERKPATISRYMVSYLQVTSPAVLFAVPRGCFTCSWWSALAHSIIPSGPGSSGDIEDV